MGRLFLVEYDQTPDLSFNCCRICRTHIALSQDLFLITPDFRTSYYRKVVNVVSDEPTHHRMHGDNLVADIHCVRCNEALGWTYIQSSSTTVPNGSVLLKSAPLLLWTGTTFITMIDEEDEDEDYEEDEEDEDEDEDEDYEDDQGSDDNVDIG